MIVDIKAKGQQQCCSVCSAKLRYPFLHWRDDPGFFICGRCCHNIKRGLTADLVQLAAIVELQRLGYDEYTFVREHKEILEKRLTEEQEEEEAVWLHLVDKQREQS